MPEPHALPPDDLAYLRAKAVADGSPWVRRSVLQKIADGWPADPRTWPLLCERAAADPHPDVRCAALAAIVRGWAGDPATLPMLHDLAGDRHKDVRVAAVRAIARTWPDDPGTLTLLAERAAADPHEHVRQVARDLLAGAPSIEPPDDVV